MSSSKARLSDLPTRAVTGLDEIANAPSHPRSGLRAQLDDDLLARLRDEHVLVAMEMQAALDICRNSEDRPAPTPRELAPQFAWLAPNTEPACDPNHALTLLLGNDFFTARGTSAPLFHERGAFDLGGAAVDGGRAPSPPVGTPGAPTTPRIP